MYYDSIEEAIKAAPDCTHVLTTSVDWARGNDPRLKGKFVAVYKVNGRFFDDKLASGNHYDVCGNGWHVAYHNNGMIPLPAKQPTPEQRLAAARFDTASGHIPAHQFLESGVKHMKDRASQRDAEDGERSMRRCVEAFNALEGTNLTETQGWRFMIMLKMARSVSGDFTADDYEDMAAYSGLAGECASTQETTDAEQHSGVELMESVSRYILNQPAAHWSDYKYFMKKQNKPYISEALYKSVHFALLQETN